MQMSRNIFSYATKPGLLVFTNYSVTCINNFRSSLNLENIPKGNPRNKLILTMNRTEID